MTPETLVTELRATGVRLTIENGKIKAAGSKAALARWLPVLRECKADLLGYLYLWVETLREHYEERAAIHEYDGGLSRAEAEASARASTGMLARNLRLPWAALRLALDDPALPNSLDPVDRPPYGLPAWCARDHGGVLPREFPRPPPPAGRGATAHPKGADGSLAESSE
jgi:hypothetical protein